MCNIIQNDHVMVLPKDSRSPSNREIAADELRPGPWRGAAGAQPYSRSAGMESGGAWLGCCSDDGEGLWRFRPARSIRISDSTLLVLEGLTPAQGR